MYDTITLMRLNFDLMVNINTLLHDLPDNFVFIVFKITYHKYVRFPSIILF